MTFEIEKTTRQIIYALYRDGNPDKAVLASLRDAVSMTSRRAQVVWPIMMANLPKEQLSRDGVPTRAEVAVYTAIRFYAIHQQGKEPLVYGPAGGDTATGMTLMSALANLRRSEDLRTALDRRVKPLLATTSVTGVVNELTHLVNILKAKNENQKIDYARLAQDLYGLQASYEQANRVRLRWGQQYFWEKTADTKNKGDQD